MQRRLACLIIAAVFKRCNFLQALSIAMGRCCRQGSSFRRRPGLLTSSLYSSELPCFFGQRKKNRLAGGRVVEQVFLEPTQSRAWSRTQAEVVGTMIHTYHPQGSSVSDGQSGRVARERGERVVGGDVQGGAAAASAASTGENSPSDRTLFFASAFTEGEKLPSDKMLFFGGTRASLAHNHSVARSFTK